MQDEPTRTPSPAEIQRALRESEERYRAFIANSSEGIWRFELEEPVPTGLPEDEQIERCYRHGYLAECNDAMARMYGYGRAGEITGARLGDLLVRVLEGGHLLRAWGTQRDATAAKEAEEELRRGDERYLSLLENANDIIYSHDLEGNYLAINRACSEVTGYTREEILGGLGIAQEADPEQLEEA